MNPVLQLILTSGFLISEEAALGFIPTVLSLLNGNAIDSSMWEERKQANLPKIVNGGVFATEFYNGLADSIIPENSVAILPVCGEISKYPYACGPRGTKALAGDIQKLNANPNIVAAVLDVDSPGGEASYTDIAANAIKNSQKPILGFVSGKACSGAQWLVSATQKVTISNDTDIMGSIGAMMMFWDLQEYYKNAGIKLQTIYATLSTNKGKDYADLMAGKFDDYRKKWLDPLNEKFHQAIKENRKGKVNPEDKELFTGMIFNGNDAIKKGLADEFGTFEQVLDEALQLGLQHKNKQKDSQTSNKTIVYV